MYMGLRRFVVVVVVIVVHAMQLLLMVSFCTADFSPKVFDVVRYGAVADGNTDNKDAFEKAWGNACGHGGPGRGVVRIPKGVFLVSKVSFDGPCRGSPVFLIKGTLKAPTTTFFSNQWIAFRYIDNLEVVGGGTLDGQGHAAWLHNDCKSNSHCNTLPATLRFDFVKNSRVQNLYSLNSKNIHINLFACENIDLSRITLSAPAQSPNTDGIHIGSSNNIRISYTRISTGDDCISMVSGSQNIDISNVNCGPGHGISIGSLGRGHDNEFVTNVSVKNCSFIDTDNGIRIKTWARSSYTLASNINFENIVMKNSRNPIIIDQQYCPNTGCKLQGQSDSSVQIRDVTFKNIWGVSGSKVALNLQCSGSVPCKNIRLIDINLAYNGNGGRALSKCANVIGTAYGRVVPSGCL